MDKHTKDNKSHHWHAMKADEALEVLDVKVKEGLDNNEATKRLDEYGKNEIPKGKSRSAWMRLLMQFHNVLIYILIIAAVITALLDHWIDTWVILAVILINAIIGFVQEGKAEKALESIRNMLSLDAVVTRNGERKTIEAENLVPGDIVHLKSGDKIPADLRLIQTRDLRVEESPLTGESTSVDKITDPVDKEAIIGDRLSMAFSGTVVNYGKATGVVIATGADTEIGKINQMISNVVKITTPLIQQIEKFGKWLSVIILGITGAFFAFGYFLRDYLMDELFLAAIGLIVASIPEGLPAIMTITLAIGVQRMAQRNAIVRRLPSVETLGAVNVICSDKTGTLTRNEMTAKTIITAENHYSIEGTGYEPEGNIMIDDQKIEPENDKVLWQLLKSIRASNYAEISKDDSGQWKLTGTPTEGALLTLSYKAGLKDFKPERKDSIPFESDHKYTATLNDVEGDMFVFLTGAPERLLDMCDKQLSSKGEDALDRDFWDEKMELVAAKGQRLLGVAFKKDESGRKEITRDSLEKNKTFLGVIGIIDPPRAEAIRAIEECKEAGVKVKMITGDHAITAKAIGKEIGIGDGEKVMSGQELEKMSEEELRKIVNEYDVYARTSPEHKLRLVEALQANGKLCAMTGDGVNDAPALKKANIGIAMGIKGTEVTKDASEMVLADDNFASIVNAIEEGRTVYDNIRKALLFILPTNGAEALVLMSAILLGMAMPITPAQILWVNMVTAVTLALAISFEPMEENVMKLPPRSSDQPILGKMFLWRISFVSILIGAFTLLIFKYFMSQGADEALARTIAVNTLVASQLFYLFNCRKIKLPSVGKSFFNNPYAFWAAGGLILLQMGFVYLPFMNTFFETQAIKAGLWLYPLAAGALVFLIVELEKFIITKIQAD
ncbi:MAG: cation-transporting P-type ATPase [Cyclobacteriaceae bacterium]|nr:cation-transporting P-type ATPase [Cyclobacteriaceae bacterium]